MAIKVYPFWGGGIDAAALATVATTGSYSDLSGRPALGDAAAKNVGTTAGTVAAGDDARLSDARPPTAHTHPASALSDSTAAGRAILTAADAADQRTALGAPSVLDANRWALEKASRGTNTIFYNAGGEEIHCVRIDAYSWADLGTAYTTGMGATGAMEAFLANGAPNTHIWVGKYPASLSASGRVVCQPGLDQWVTISWDESFAACAALGTVSGHTARLMSLWDWAAITHIVMASGRGQPQGNTSYGQALAAKWQRGRRVDGVLPGVASGDARVLSGSGPRDWVHDLGDFGVWGLVGNVWEWLSGGKLVNGVWSLAPDNGAATTEASWVVQGGYTMPESATWGALANAGASDLLKRALIVPATGVTSPVGYCTAAVDGERLPLRGGGWSNGGYAGLAALYVGYARSSRYASVGCRPAFVP